MSRLVAAALSTGMASYRDLDEHMSVEDCWDVVEVARVNAHNARLIDEALRAARS